MRITVPHPYCIIETQLLREEVMARYTPVAWTFHADIYCGDCGDKLPSIDPEGNDKHPVFGWETSELAGYACGECGEPAEEW